MPLSQQTRTLAVTTPLGEDILLLRSMKGKERLSILFGYELDLISKDITIRQKDRRELNAMLMESPMIGPQQSCPESANTPEKTVAQRLDGVVVGVLLGFHEDGAPLVVFPGNPQETALEARATTRLQGTDIGREVALLFEGGDPSLPLVIGVVQHPGQKTEARAPFTADPDGERVVLSAQKEIVLKCGKSSITLTHAGKILILGAYLLSRSSGVNRAKGGSVQLN